MMSRNLILTLTRVLTRELSYY